jgi:hypothetical protein
MRGLPRMIWGSRTAAGTGRPEPLAEDGGNLVLGTIARAFGIV